MPPVTPRPGESLAILIGSGVSKRATDGATDGIKFVSGLEHTYYSVLRIHTNNQSAQLLRVMEYLI